MKVVTPYTQKIPTDKISFRGTQQRKRTDGATVDRYYEAYKEGKKLPPPIVYYDQAAGVYWGADGEHRILAQRNLGRKEIECEVRHGTRREALLAGLKANRDHGLPFGRNDVRNAVKNLLGDAEWKHWSDSQIAEAVGCSPSTVASVRKESQTVVSIVTYTDRNGRTVTRDVNVNRETGRRRKEANERKREEIEIAEQNKRIRCPHCLKAFRMKDLL